MKAILALLAVSALAALAGAQPIPRPPARESLPPRFADRQRPAVAGLPGKFCLVQSIAGGERGIAVRVLMPAKPRYPVGAPVIIHVTGGVQAGSAGGRPEFVGLGFVEIFFAFPGGGVGEERSGGTYDFRGTNCHRAFADVIRFATGRLADKQGHKITDLVGDTEVLTRNVGVLGSSHGGNACGLVTLLHGSEFPDLAFYASMESPYGEGSVNVELGGRETGVNPAYNPKTGELDLSKLAWSPDLTPGLRGRETPEARQLRGSLFFDMDGDGKFSRDADFPANAFVADLGAGAKAWYSPRLVREAEQRELWAGKGHRMSPRWLKPPGSGGNEK